MIKSVRHLEAVTVCVGYADFLQATAQWNAGLFDRWIIGTLASDEQTRWVCNRFNLECLISDDVRRHTHDGKSFNKGRLIERLLQQTSNNGHRLHLDCDIALPHRFRHLLDIAELDDEFLYGCDRANIHSFEDYQKVVASGYLQGGSWAYHCQHSFPKTVKVDVGDRFIHPKMGYVPIGYFQLWHSSQDEWNGIRHRTYPSEHSSASRTDVQWGLKWDRHRRSVIPELIALHLESERVSKGTNWNGRKTKWFGPLIKYGPKYGCKPGGSL